MYYSPTYGKLEKNQLESYIASYIKDQLHEAFRIIVGVDSQKGVGDSYDFVTALVIQKVGSGAIYFWKREVIKKKIALKERMYMEAIMSLQSAEDFLELFKGIGIEKYEIEIHVDIGQNGKTQDLINSIVGMVRSNGYTVKIKPESFGASKVADRHT